MSASHSQSLRSDRDEVCPFPAEVRPTRIAAMKIWIDLDNTPHVPFFKPLIGDLERKGFKVALTARDAFQVCELATAAGMKYQKVGRHYGKNRFLKVWGLGWRSLQLLPFVMRERPVLGLSHGSRAQILLCNLLRIPTVMIMDYEHAQTPPLVRPRWEIVPEVLATESLHCKERANIRTYSGIKEDVYASAFRPDDALLERLGLQGSEIIVTARPPANEAHYHNSQSEDFFVAFMKRACATPRVKVILLPRNKHQEAQIRSRWPQWFVGSKVVIPTQAVDGLNLLWHSDLAVSGGGTMNREAAALGVPVYSVFRGKLGAVDRQLEKEGRLTLIERPEDVIEKIRLQPRTRQPNPAIKPSKALQQISAHVMDIIGFEQSGRLALSTSPTP